MGSLIFVAVVLAAIFLVFGMRGLRALAGVFLVCCLVGTIGVGGLIAYWVYDDQQKAGFTRCQDLGLPRDKPC